MTIRNFLLVVAACLLALTFTVLAAYASGPLKRDNWDPVPGTSKPLNPAPWHDPCGPKLHNVISDCHDERAEPREKQVDDYDHFHDDPDHEGGPRDDNKEGHRHSADDLHNGPED